MSSWKKLAGASAGEIVWSADLAKGTSNRDNVSVASLSPAGYLSKIRFNNDGSKLYGSIADTLYEFDLSTKDDLSTISYNSVSFSYSSQSTEAFGFCFNPDGTKMYIVSRRPPDSVYQYSLSTAFDISTASYDSKSLSVTSQDNDPQDVFLNADGTKMYMLGDGNRMYQYTLSTAFDVSTGSYDSVSFTFAFQNSTPSSIFVIPDGTKLYMVGRQSGNSRVYEYDMSTAYDISTMSYNSVNLDVLDSGNPSGGSETPTGFAFSADGTTMVVRGGTHNNLISFDLS